MSQFRNLVFEGGGVKGIAYGGALQVLEEKHILPDIRRVAGTSAGAITAALLAVGATGKDVEEIIGSTDFRSFMDDSWGVGRDVHRLVTEYGWYKGDAFGGWMRKLLTEFTGNPDITFGELYRKAMDEPDRFRELHVVGANLTMGMDQVFNGRISTNLPVWEGVRISMSIPLFFAAHMLHDNQVCVDGGVVWNYPISIFDDRDLLDNQDAGVEPTYTKYNDRHVFNKETLGFRVDTEDEITAAKRAGRKPPETIESFVDYLSVILPFILDMANKRHLHKNDWHRTVFIDDGDVGATEFSLSDAKVAKLVTNGRTFTEKYFDWFDDPSEEPINKL